MSVCRSFHCAHQAFLGFAGLMEMTKWDSRVNESVEVSDLAGMLRFSLEMSRPPGASESKKDLTSASFCIVRHHSKL
jgi:hypothetical protein